MEQFPHEVTIHSLSGSHFEIGHQLGQRVKSEQGPNYIDKSLAVMSQTSLYEMLGMVFDLTPKYIDEVFPVVESVLKKVHPDLLEEMRGFAQGLGEDYRRLVVYTSNFGLGKGCSQFFLNGYLARNYDDAPGAVEGEFAVSTPTGSFKSFGSTIGYLERLDGINEKGVAVSLTFGAGHPPIQHGIGSAMFTRIVLDKAGSVEEAIELFEKAPYVTPNNVMIADSSGNAVVIEASAGQYHIRKPEEGIFICANSYLAPEMRKHQRINNKTTKWREQAMLRKEPNLANRAELMNFLTTDFPDGLFEPYYSVGLGTLWSVIYHPKTLGVHLAIGEKGQGRQDFKFSLKDQDLEAKLPITLSTTLEDRDLIGRIPQLRA